MPKRTAKEFIDLHGVVGLRDAIGCKTEGSIVRGNDYALVSHLLFELKAREEQSKPTAQALQAKINSAVKVLTDPALYPEVKCEFLQEILQND